LKWNMDSLRTCCSTLQSFLKHQSE
jgi:hypothetical protein